MPNSTVVFEDATTRMAVNGRRILTESALLEALAADVNESSFVSPEDVRLIGAQCDEGSTTGCRARGGTCSTRICVTADTRGFADPPGGVCRRCIGRPGRLRPKEYIVSGTDKANNKIEDLGGKAKEALGKATGDKSTANEGKADQSKSSLKDAGEKVKDAFKK